MRILKLCLLIYLNFLASPFIYASSHEDPDDRLNKSSSSTSTPEMVPAITLTTMPKNISNEEIRRDKASSSPLIKNHKSPRLKASNQASRLKASNKTFRIDIDNEKNESENSIAEEGLFTYAYNSAKRTPEFVRKVVRNAVVNNTPDSVTSFVTSASNYFKGSRDEQNRELVPETKEKNQHKFRKSFNEKITKEIEERQVKGKVIKRIEKEKKKKQAKEEIINAFKNLKDHATQKQVFQLMKTANLHEDAKEFVYTSIYYLFLLDHHHPYDMVNEGWLCIRGRFETAPDAASQINEMKFSPLSSHLKSLKRIDPEFAKDIPEY